MKIIGVSVTSGDMFFLSTQRGEDVDLLNQTNSSGSVFYSDEVSGCLQEETQVSNAPAWCAGTYVWTVCFVCILSIYYFCID